MSDLKNYPMLVRESKTSAVVAANKWPTVHIWDDGKMVIEERRFIWCLDNETHELVLKPWDALSLMGRPDKTFVGTDALSFLRTRLM